MDDEKGRVVENKRQHTPQGMRRAAVARRFDALFKAMSTDILLREQFITDPAQILSEYVHGTSLPPQKASVTNQLLYSVLSNPKLLGWLRDYSIKHKGDPPSSQKFMGDFGRAAVESGGHHVVLALIRGAAEKESVFGFDEDLVPIIFDIFNRGGIGSSGTEMSTGTSFGTEQSGTHMSTGGIMVSGTEMSTGGGTEMSTGTRGGTEMSTGNIMVSGTEMSTGTSFGTEQSGTHMSTGGIMVSGTEMSTGGGTEMSTGGGTEMSTGGIMVSGTEMSTGTSFGTEQSGTHMSTGGIMVSGTEMSTGGGTEMSTGTGGTEMSTGTRVIGGGIDIFPQGHFRVTLEALTQYAMQLRDSGALDTI
jgi:hypothetical protein